MGYGFKGQVHYPVKWNHDFMDLPEVKDQRTPVFSAEEISTIISKAEGQYQVLYALLAGTGLRIEEAFALQVEDIEHSVIRVRHSCGTASCTRQRRRPGSARWTSIIRWLSCYTKLPFEHTPPK